MKNMMFQKQFKKVIIASRMCIHVLFWVFFAKNANKMAKDGIGYDFYVKKKKKNLSPR